MTPSSKYLTGSLPKTVSAMLWRSVFRPMGSTALDKRWEPGTVRKLFDKEVDNHHEEALLLAQLAAWQLSRLLQQALGPAAAALKASVSDWYSQVLQVSALSMPGAISNSADVPSGSITSMMGFQS
jgi:hypothetical protein